MENAAIEETIRECFARDPHGAAAVYLFGSRARGTNRPDSDVDVGVLFEEAPPKTLQGPVMDLDRELEEALGFEVDVVSLNDASADLRHRVLRDGKLLVERNRSRRIAWQVRTRNEYFDLLPILRRIRRGSEVKGS